MKVAAKGLFVFFSMCFFANAGCSQQKPLSKLQVIKLSDSDAGKTTDLAKGQIFTLTLPDHIDGGYRFDRPLYDSTILHLDKLSERSPAANSPMGHPGLAVWQFSALKAGKTILEINASRPWKGGGTVTIFKNTVVVK